MHPDFHRFTPRIPAGGFAALFAGGTIFALLNAAAEEVAWRGVIQDALEARLGTFVAIVGQGIAFGAGHYAGIPGGIVGVVLAGLFGILLGILRQAENGLLLCILTHICADATIYTLVAAASPR
jgi:membrane protease YdiL (CAAX protease family)